MCFQYLLPFSSCCCACLCHSGVTVICLQQLLYTFDKEVCVSSCSLNKEETLLGESLPSGNNRAAHLANKFLPALSHGTTFVLFSLSAISLTQNTRGEERLKPSNACFSLFLLQTALVFCVIQPNAIFSLSGQLISTCNLQYRSV